MNKYIATLCCAATLFSSASATILFQEDFQGLSISGDTPISDFGWVNDIELYDTRVYVGNAAWTWGPSVYTEAFYTTTNDGAGFTSFDLDSVNDLTFAVDIMGSSSVAPYFAIQLNGGTNWFVSATPIAVPGGWTTHQMPFDPSSLEWNYLTVSGTGTVNTAGASIGMSVFDDLAGTVTGVGLVITRLSGGVSMDWDNFAVLSDVATSVPAAPSITKLWMNGTTAKLYWGGVTGATNYIVKTSGTSGGPYSFAANTTNTSFWVTNLVADTTNYFVIAAENAVGEGDPSAEESGVARSYSIIADSDSSWGDWLFSYKEAAFDGDVDNFYDSAETNGLTYVGLDYGAGNGIVPAELMYYPRTAYPARMLNAEFQGSNDGFSWDPLATITSVPAVEQWHSVYYSGSTSYQYVRLLFAAEGHGNVSEIAFGTNLPPFHTIVVNPADGSELLGPANVTLSAEIVEWDSEFDAADLYLNGALVASNNTPSVDGTNLVSYAAGELAIGSYTGQVIVAGVNPAVTLTNTWTFEVIPTPSASAIKLWNINMAGNVNATYTVTDGSVIAAPSTGSDQWNNLISPYDDYVGGDTNEFTWLPTNALSIVDANGANPIGLKWSGSDLDWSFQDTPVDELFIGYFGSGSFDNTMEISGLDPSAKYDIYAYFTWGWNENWVGYEITEGSGAFTNIWFLPERDNVTSGTYADIVRGQNYVVFTQLSPSPSGNIHINANSTDGGWSGLQIAEVSSTGPTMDPDIQSITVSGGSVSLQWISELGVKYSIMRKTSLTDPSWTAVKTDIDGGDPTTSDSVLVSGSNEEFYSIEGQ